MKLRASLVILAALGVAGCAAHTPATSGPGSSASAARDGGLIHARNEGYSLLYRLMSDEGNVDKILLIKDADPALKQIIKRIAKTSSDAKEELDGYQKEDGHAEFNVPDLPRIEQETRDQEAKVDENELLFSNGKTFQLRLILTQLQATRYGNLMCTALVQIEDQPYRKDFLAKLSADLRAYHDQLADLVEAK